MISLMDVLPLHMDDLRTCWLRVIVPKAIESVARGRETMAAVPALIDPVVADAA